MSNKILEKHKNKLILEKIDTCEWKYHQNPALTNKN
jgi:hypothetical protein